MQVKAFARQDGMLMALLWTTSFACYTLLKAGAIADLLTISTPIFLAWRMSKFRDYALGAVCLFPVSRQWRIRTDYMQSAYRGNPVV